MSIFYSSVSNKQKKNKKERPKPKKYTHIINTERTLKMRAVSGHRQLRGGKCRKAPNPEGSIAPPEGNSTTLEEVAGRIGWRNTHSLTQ